MKGTPARVLGATLAVAGCTRHAPHARALIDAATPALGTVDATLDVPLARVVFAPRWTCRITGLGRVGRPPVVSVPRLRPHDDPRAICDTLPLTQGGLVARDPVQRDDHLLPDVAYLQVRSHADASVIAREISVSPQLAEFLVDAPAGPGLGVWNGATVHVTPVDPAAATYTLALAANPAACAFPVTDPLRLTPIAAHPMPFPAITGMPPSTADARWTLARDAHGVCVLRLEGAGPWGNVRVQAMPDGMHGELSLSEGLYPVTCAPMP